MVFLCLRRDKSLECEGKKMNIERQIEFDKVKDIWAGLAITDWAKEKIKEEEFLEYFSIKYGKVTHRDKWKRIDVGKYHNVGIIPIDEYLDWLNAHHFDYRGLIEKGLALVAPDGMYN